MEEIKRGRGRPKKPRYDMTPENGFSVDLSVDDNPNVFEAVDMSDQHAERVARGYFVGNTAVGRRQDVRKMLEDKVIGKIGKSGKLLVDKLFELVEGVYQVDKINKVHGKEEIRYYKTPPNLNAIIYALDRALGKPKQVNIQGNFSLSQLLINDNTGNTGNGRAELRQSNNEEDGGKPDIFY